MSATHYTLMLPGLVQAFALTKETDSDFHLVNKFLRKASHQVIDEDDTALKFKLLTGSVPDELPLARMSAVADGLQVRAYVVRADPVELKVNGFQAYMLGSRHLNLTKDELTQLASTLNPLLNEFNLTLSFMEKGHGYLFSSTPLKLKTSPPDLILGQPITDFFPEGEDQKFWLRLMTEMQMELRECALNQRRDELGLPRVDALWLWGQGEFEPERTPSRFKSIVSDDEIILGLAETLKYPYEKMTLPVQCIIEESARHPGRHLLCSSKMLASGDANECVALMRELFYPVLKAINDRKITSLELYPGDKHCYHVALNVLRTWWKPWSRK